MREEKNFLILKINNYDYFYNKIITIYQALIQKSWYIPRFCFHVKLSISGNCRMCFVELKNINKPIISCATNISNNLNLYTNTLLSFKARENILEFILINHPIDCPICDQGGECDLQDQYTVMGSINSRFYDGFKKSNKNKNINFLIKLSLNKCINCSRCIRFSNQILGDYTFSLLGRGENSVISTYVKTLYNFEIMGNVMDLCPVGALTSKLISYDFRIWELIDLKFIDIKDSMLPPIRLDFRGLRIQRILPLTNSNTGEEWISDLCRYSYSYMFKNRFFLPKIKLKNKFVSFSWNNFFNIFKSIFSDLIKFFVKKKLYFLNSINLNKNKTDVYIYEYYKFYFNKFSLLNLKKNYFNKYNVNRNYFLKNKNTDFLKIDHMYILFVNLRYNFPLINYKVREKMIFDYIPVFVLGSFLNLNYYYVHVGNSLSKFFKFLKNKNLKEKSVVFYNKNININFCFDNIKFYNLEKNSFVILKNELGFLNCINFNNFKNVFNFNFVNSKCFFNKNFANIYNSVFLNQNFQNIKSYKMFIPKKFNFEQNSMFISIFGIFYDFTFLSYKSDQKTLKNDWNFFSIFFKNFFFNKTKKLSFIRSKFISKKWIYTYYNNIILNYNFFNFSFIINYKNFFLKNFYSVNFNNLDLRNNFVSLLSVSSIYWIF